jgi:hypothetical protein
MIFSLYLYYQYLLLIQILKKTRMYGLLAVFCNTPQQWEDIVLSFVEWPHINIPPASLDLHGWTSILFEMAHLQSNEL